MSLNRNRSFGTVIDFWLAYWTGYRIWESLLIPRWMILRGRISKVFRERYDYVISIVYSNVTGHGEQSPAQRLKQFRFHL